MKPKDPKVIEILNDVLTGELTAINQYFLHAEIVSSWGLKGLYAEIRKQSIEEMVHAERLIERVLFLEGLPNVQRLGKIRIGENLQEVYEADLALEMEALPRLSEGIAYMREVGDTGSQLLLEEILVSEEKHVDWIEEQLELINRIGLENYQALNVSAP